MLKFPKARVRRIVQAFPFLLLIALLFEPACFFRKHGSAHTPLPASPIRTALLPFNVPQENAELNWASLAVPALMAQVMENAPDLDAVPLWESVPVTIQALGSSRTITPEVASYAASRLAARWSVLGNLAPARGGISLQIDFIPSRASLVPFRYEKESSVDGLESRLREAVEQFTRYLVLRPLEEGSTRPLEPGTLESLGSALDLEYGWLETAKPGEATRIVDELAQSDSRLARLLFSPASYPALGTQPAGAVPAKPPHDSNPVRRLERERD